MGKSNSLKEDKGIIIQQQEKKNKKEGGDRQTNFSSQ